MTRRVLRVRMDVDETDINKVRVGQKAYITADAFGDHKFWGHVVRVGEQLGPKNVRTDEPTERVDRKILETLVELDQGVKLPVGLRVDTYIVGRSSGNGACGKIRRVRGCTFPFRKKFPIRMGRITVHKQLKVRGFAREIY